MNYKTVLDEWMRADIVRRDLPLLDGFFGGIDPNQEFYLTDSALVVYYQPYRYTPYVYGPLEFKIPFSTISGPLRPEFGF